MNAFKVAGNVAKKWTNDKASFARLTIAIAEGDRTRRIDVRAFDAPLVAKIAALAENDAVEVSGVIEPNKVTSKDREPVLVDGYPRFEMVLTVKTMKVEASKPVESPQGDDNVPW